MLHAALVEPHDVPPVIYGRAQPGPEIEAPALQHVQGRIDPFLLGTMIRQRRDAVEELRHARNVTLEAAA